MLFEKFNLPVTERCETTENKETIRRKSNKLNPQARAYEYNVKYSTSETSLTICENYFVEEPNSTVGSTQYSGINEFKSSSQSGDTNSQTTQSPSLSNAATSAVINNFEQLMIDVNTGSSQGHHSFPFAFDHHYMQSNAANNPWRSLRQTLRPGQEQNRE